MSKRTRGAGEGSISKRPDGTWCARATVGYDENGKQKRKAFYGKTRKEVQDKLTEALREINGGDYKEPLKITVGEWLEIWFEDYYKRTVKPQTFNNNYINYKRYAQTLSHIKLQDLSVVQVQGIINNLSGKGLSLTILNRVYNPLNQAIDQAIINDILKKI